MSYALKSIARTVSYCESDADCISVLHKLMERKVIDKAPVHSDITSLRADMLPPNIQLISAGFPCQDVSAANPNGEGIHGKRSGLVKHVFRLVDELPSVSIVFLENSPFIQTRGLQYIERSFRKRGFSCRWGIFACQELGAPMLRKRWYCVAERQALIHQLQVPHAAHIKHNWSREPVPRLVQRENRITDKVYMRRCQMLGNAIVPQCAVHAFNTLLLGHDPNPLQQPHPGVTIELKQGTTVYRRNTWASPSTMWRHYIHLTDRSTHMLSNQLFYDAKTLQMYRTRSRLSMLYRINPEWIEWLMGYPRRYTVY